MSRVADIIDSHIDSIDPILRCIGYPWEYGVPGEARSDQYA